MTSQEIQLALREQTKAIQVKQIDVKEDLDKVEPAVIEAQQCMFIYISHFVGHIGQSK